MQFAPGDVVQLKSGGPPMTVERVGKDPKTQEETTWCTWFEKVGHRQELHRENFAPIVLEKYEPTLGFVAM